jgi:hypothetical protein
MAHDDNHEQGSQSLPGTLLQWKPRELLLQLFHESIHLRFFLMGERDV